MKSKIKFRLILAIFIFTVGIECSTMGAECSSLEYRNVLFISSYSLSFDTVPQQIEGINEVFKDRQINLDVEFMDTRRFSEEEDISRFHDTLKRKLSKIEKYDAVIVGDDAALIFAMNYKEELFPDIPIVFLAINSMSLALEAGEDPLITGVVEQNSFKENIELAMKLQPRANKILALVDSTLTGKADEENFFTMEEAFPELEFMTLDAGDYTFDEIGEELSKIKEDTIVFFLTMFEDKNGTYYSISDGVSLIKNYANVPVFRISIGGVGEGLIGGIMVSYKESGKIAADMVLDIMGGRAAADIPVDTKSPNFGYFDYNILKQYNISPDVLPESSNIINREPRFFEVYRTQLFTLAMIFLVLLVIVLLLLFDNRRRKKLMNEDYLTKLRNRMCMGALLDKTLAKHTKCAVVMLDIDDFKRINDSLGHVYGDELLIGVADRLRKMENRDMKVSRFGGDEFLCVITYNEEAWIEAKIKEIIQMFEPPFIAKGEKHKIQISVGAAVAPKDSMVAEELISFADTAMYTVKGTGKNGYAFFCEEMRKEVTRQKDIVVILREAIERDGFYLRYQPQIDTATKQLVGFEALLRLKEHQISPVEFIAVAEQTGLIVQIGRIVTEKVIRQISEWKEQGFSGFSVAINFSNRQLRDSEYLDFLQKLFNRYRVEPSMIEIEITESIFLKKTEESMQLMNGMVESGIKLSLDDFGTGYSAINYLTFMPIYKMKLDKSFIDKFSATEDIRTISNIINLAHGLGLKVTAEGVETEEQFTVLSNVNCDYIQGYYFDKPLTVEEINKKYFC